MEIGDERQRVVAMMTAILLSSQMETIGSGAKARLVARSASACISGFPPSVCGGGSAMGAGSAARHGAPSTVAQAIAAAKTRNAERRMARPRGVTTVSSDRLSL